MAYEGYNEAYEPKKEYPFYRVDFHKELGGGPGTLIRPAQPMTGYAALEAARATYRVIYESTSGTDAWHGEPIGVSGTIAFPDDITTTMKPWRVLSWAHGTVGSADKCAPSMDEYLGVDVADTGLGLLRKINKAPHDLLNAFLRDGWVVAMTDYEGLGTYGVHPYLLGDSEGRGILDIVPAVRHLAEQLDIEHEIAGEYAIVGHSQGGQAALWAAHLHGSYATPGTLLGVAALAPASNLKGDGLIPVPPAGEGGLLRAYQSPTDDEDVIGDVAAFFPLFTNGVLAGDRRISAADLFQPDALAAFERDRDTLARVELSESEFWMGTVPLTFDPRERAKGIFKQQNLVSGPMTEAWTRYWQVVDDKFNPGVKVTVPIRISQAEGDERVVPEKTRKLIGQLKKEVGRGPVTEVFYQTVAVPDPPGLKDHFGLLADPREIADVVGWVSHPLPQDTSISR